MPYDDIDLSVDLSVDLFSDIMMYDVCIIQVMIMLICYHSSFLGL